MKRVMVRYKLKSDRVAENEQYVRNVYEALKQTAPSGLRYATFKLEDGVSFVHIASIETTDGSNPLPQLPAFKAFLEGIKDRCEEPPAAVEINEIGSYRFFD